MWLSQQWRLGFWRVVYVVDGLSHTSGFNPLLRFLGRQVTDIVGLPLFLTMLSNDVI
jgi:hypothetical protein